MADLLAETFSQNSSSQNGKPKFITVKQNAEKYKLNFQSKNLVFVNGPRDLGSILGHVIPKT